MSGKVIITTPFPTPDEVAAYLRIPAKRVAELRRMIDEVRAETSRSDRNKKARRNGGRALSTRGKATRAKK